MADNFLVFKRGYLFVVMIGGVVAGSWILEVSKFCAIERKSWNAGFDISVAMYLVHLAISSRALGSLV